MAIVQLLTEFGLKEQPRKIEYFWVLQDTLIAAYVLESRSQLPEGTLETLCKEFGELSDAVRVAFLLLVAIPSRAMSPSGARDYHQNWR